MLHNEIGLEGYTLISASVQISVTKVHAPESLALRGGVGVYNFQKKTVEWLLLDEQHCFWISSSDCA